MRVNTAITYLIVLDTCNTRCVVMTSFNAVAAFVFNETIHIVLPKCVYKAAISNVIKII